MNNLSSLFPKYKYKGAIFLYLCIDLKSFYASVECIERNYNPLTTPLVVADASKGKGSICLAISPALKNKGVRNRCRLYEIPETIFYIIAKPRMKKYIEYSARIYRIFLQFVAKEDIHVYSIDESFIYIQPYLHLYKKTPIEMGKIIIEEIFKQTKLIATCGVGSNLFLAKVALDLLAKNSKDGIAFLNEPLFKEKLWDYTPLSDIWQIGVKSEKRLNKLHLYTLKDIAFAPQEILFDEFKSNAIELIEHAWGKESTTMKDIKNYITDDHSLSSGQTLERDYSYDEVLLIVKEMVELLSLDLIHHHYVTDGISISISYSHQYNIKTTRKGKRLDIKTNSYEILKKEILELYQLSTHKNIPIRKIRISFHVINDSFEQYHLLFDEKKILKEKKLHETIDKIKDKHGKSAIIRGMNLQKNATTLKRNKQIGGHNES